MLQRQGNVYVDRMPMAVIQSGDLLAWRRDSHSTTSDLLIQSIRVLTASNYGHVGIAWRCHDGLDDELFVIEATMPKIRLSRVVPDRDFDCIPMNVGWNSTGKAFLVDKLGLPYSPLDAIRAGLGWKLKADNKWQCAELAHYFYNDVYGIKLEHNFTPGGLVKSAESYTGRRARRVVMNTSRTDID